MSDFIEWCIVASAITGYVNFVFLVIIDNKLREIKRETSKEKGGIEVIGNIHDNPELLKGGEG